MLGRVRDFTHPALMTCPEKSPRTLRVLIACLRGLNANMAAHTGTCTMSDASQLFGIILSLPLYTAALVLIAFLRPGAQRGSLRFFRRRCACGRPPSP